jgi:hypothetical protein
MGQEAEYLLRTAMKGWTDCGSGTTLSHSLHARKGLGAYGKTSQGVWIVAEPGPVLFEVLRVRLAANSSSHAPYRGEESSRMLGLLRDSRCPSRQAVLS